MKNRQSFDMDTSKAIVMWQFFNAPKEYQELCDCGGDEEAIVFIPVGVLEPAWLENLWTASGHEPRFVNVEGGSLVYWTH
jgi:hypothetical protein